MHYWMGSLLAVAVGFVLDLLLGDPNSAYHPICLIGRLIAFTEKKTRALFPKTKTGERTAGGVTALIVVLLSTGIPALLLVLAYHLSFAAGVLAEAVVCYFVLATKSLKKGGMNVKKCAGAGRTLMPGGGWCPALSEEIPENLTSKALSRRRWRP